MNILRSRLYEIEKEKHEAELDELRGPKKSRLIKLGVMFFILISSLGLRAGAETGNVESVLSDGDLDPVHVAYHRWVVGGKDWCAKIYLARPLKIRSLLSLAVQFLQLALDIFEFPRTLAAGGITGFAAIIRAVALPFGFDCQLVYKQSP